MEYVVEPGYAEPQIVQEIHDFFANNPEPGIRQIALDEIEQLTSDGLFYVARVDGAIVGTLYFQDSKAVWEIGGALVTQAHRERGILNCLSVVALVAHHLGNLDPGGGFKLHRPIVGRVLKGNPKPINSLKRMNFVLVKEIEIDPKGKKGVQAMPLNAKGMVEALEFAFDESSLLDYVRVAVSYRDTGVLKGKAGITSMVSVAIPVLAEEEGFDPLKELLVALGGP